MEPERVLPRVRDLGCETIVFLDAVDVGAKPGSVVVMDGAELVGRFPQVSTHKLSLGTLAKLAADGNESRVYVIGIQPETIAFDGEGLSDAVETSVRMLAQGIADLFCTRICQSPSASEGRPQSLASARALTGCSLEPHQAIEERL